MSSTPHPDYHHATLLAYGFTEQSEGFYQRPADERRPALHAIHKRGRGLYLWELGHTHLQADSVPTGALRTILTRLVGKQLVTIDTTI